MKRLFAIALLAAMLPVATVHAQLATADDVTTEDYRIYRSDGTPATWQDVFDSLGGADVVFVGELHNDPVSHYVEERVFEGWFEAHGHAAALSLEMFARDVQYIVDEYLAGHITENHFQQSSSPWSNYETDYRPLVEFARENGLAVIAANAPRRYANMVSRNGRMALRSLSDQARSYLAPLPFAAASERYEEQWDQVMAEAMAAMRADAEEESGPAPEIDNRHHGESEEMDHSEMDHGSMDHGDMSHGDMNHGDMSHGEMDHSEMNHEEMDHGEMDHSGMDHSGMNHGDGHEMGEGGHSCPKMEEGGECKMMEGGMEGMEHGEGGHSCAMMEEGGECKMMEGMEGMDHSGMDHGDGHEMGEEEMDHSSMDHEAMREMHHPDMTDEEYAKMKAEKKEGMSHEGMDHGDMDHGDMDHSDMDHGEMDHGDMDHSEMNHAAPATQPQHGGGSMLDAQSLWDATMAWSIAEHMTRNPGAKVAHMVGGFHVETGTGTPEHLMQYRPGTRMLIISVQSVDDPTSFDLEEHTGLGDFVVLGDAALPRTYETRTR